MVSKRLWKKPSRLAGLDASLPSRLQAAMMRAVEGAVADVDVDVVLPDVAGEMRWIRHAQYKTFGRKSGTRKLLAAKLAHHLISER